MTPSMMPRWPRAVLLAALLVTSGVAGCLAGSPGEGQARPPTNGSGTDAATPIPPSARPNGTGHAAGLEPPLPPVHLELLATGLQAPTSMAPAGDGSGRLFLVEQSGTVRTIRDGRLEPEPYLNLTDRVMATGERGLFDVAVSPDFATNGDLYASYTDRRGESVLEHFTVEPPATGRPDAANGTVVLGQPQPFANHNGGEIAFGPDGYLYLGLGDGGAAGDPMRNAQNASTWLGKILRLNVTGANASAPGDNPQVGQPGNDLVWALGLRNPWRFSFDLTTGDLYIADVGQDGPEEINHQPANATGGANYGWNLWEGFDRYRGPASQQGQADPAATRFPILAYQHGQERCSVTGGYVYRGQAIPRLRGHYLYADYCSGEIWAARQVQDGWSSALLLDTNLLITSFGQDPAGEVYVVAHSGTVNRLVPG